MFVEPKFDSFYELSKALPTEESARRYLAFVRWGGHPRCYHCGHQGECAYDPKRKFFYCGLCAKQFSSTKGTIMERCHIPLMTWFWAIFELANGSLSSKRLAKKLKVNQRTAWKMEHKIREMLKGELEATILNGTAEADTAVLMPRVDRDFQRNFQIKQMQKIIEKDNDTTKRDLKNKWERERKRRMKLGLPSPKTGRPKGKLNKISWKNKGENNQYYKYQSWLLGMVERGGKIYLQKIGQHTTDINVEKVAEIMKQHVTQGTRVITDGGGEFENVSKHFEQHDRIIHDPWIDYIRKDGTAGKRQVKKFVDGDKYTNTIEGAWAHLKRIKWGHHVQVTYQHLDRYLYEFAFQWNNRSLSDAEKFKIILRSSIQKALPYNEFKMYTRIYFEDENAVVIGKRSLLKQAS